MPFLTQSKTNWKFLLIVVILAIIVGGGILWCVEKQELSYQPLEIQGPADIDETADWQTYNGMYFSFKYPLAWMEETGLAFEYPENLEVIGLRISPNAVFEASYKNYSYENNIQRLTNTKRSVEKIIVTGREATRFESVGSGETLPIGFSIISVIVKDSENTSYEMVFNGDRSDITDQLINQILSTFRFIEPEIMSEEEAINLVRNLPEVAEWLSLFTGPDNTSSATDGKPMIIIDGKSEQGYSIHVYEKLSDHTATFNWYSVNSKTGEIAPMF